MDKTKKEHPLDRHSKRGLSLFDSPKQARQATQAFENQLAKRFPGQPKNKLHQMRWLAIAASLLLLVGAFYMISGQTEQHSADLITAYNWKVSPQSPLPVAALAPNRDGRESAVQLLMEGREAYAIGSYQEATRHFNEYLKISSSPRSEVYLYLGHAQLEQEPKQALQTLDHFLNNNELDAYYLDLAHWFKAWAYLEMDDQEQAEAELGRINDKDSPIFSDAQQLLKLLTGTGPHTS